MATLTPKASALLRSCARQQLPVLRASSVATQRRGKASPAVEQASGEIDRTPTFQSPFRDLESKPTTMIPDFSHYKSARGSTTNKTFQYFMVGSMGLLTAMGAKATVEDFLVSMSASADVLAQAKVEIDLSTIAEGKNVIIKWRGKPVFIRHRTEDEIKEAEDTKWESLRDPQPDSERVKKPEWLIMVGCVPIGESGDFGGWFCPCHGSHYDISGRARKGPAPLNLEVPEYDFPQDNSVVIG
ncbi:MAG: hsp70 nucleotide exchange factor fes1 [Candelaria pacifica]|nr:MAG: hsp70 nucleotide exchange factor fes1 [Candelaria pacifica]